nr:hypothetical protein [Morchella crassipes]
MGACASPGRKLRLSRGGAWKIVFLTCTPPPPSIIIFRPYSFFSLSRPRSCTLPPSLSFFERKRRRGACKEREKKVKEDEGGGGVHEQGREALFSLFNFLKI